MLSQSDDDLPTPSRSRLPLILLAGAIALVAVFLGIRVLAPLVSGPAPKPVVVEPKPATKPAPPPVAEAPAPDTSTAPEPARPRSRRKVPAPAPAESAAPAAPTTGELHIDSDVPGAMVFLDRVYLGTVPVTAGNVAPGAHQLNASAEGHDGYSETINVEPGSASITVRFKVIRLDETLAVVHKHGMGSCEGRLLADPQGIRYVTTHKDDAFSLRFAEIETFAVDYLNKNLRIKRRGGKTWNFTTRTENADPLFVFHRNVEKVRLQVIGAAAK